MFVYCRELYLNTQSYDIKRWDLSTSFSFILVATKFLRRLLSNRAIFRGTKESAPEHTNCHDTVQRMSIFFVSFKPFLQKHFLSINVDIFSIFYHLYKLISNAF